MASASAGVDAGSLVRSAARVSHVRWPVADINAEVRRSTEAHETTINAPHLPTLRNLVDFAEI
ncbi:hypothetical protein MY10362_006246 [Beauveria mimosiformis]